jgi:cyclophilin family peptidyl-prolyl cis-trans isomerase/HEAT repeat protein
MNRHGSWLFLMVAAAAGCTAPEIVNPAPSKLDDLLALARRQDPASIGAMEDALTHGVSARERALAAFGLGQLALAWEPPSVEVKTRAEASLLDALGAEKDPDVRDRIVEALGKTGSAASVAALAPIVSGAKGEPRRTAAVALGLIARSSQRKAVSDAAREGMTSSLKDADPAVRFGGAYGLRLYRDPATKPAFTACLKDTDADVRSTCAKAFATLGAGSDAPLLAPLLVDPDDRVAAEAARTLSKLAIGCAPGATEACPPLAALMATPGPLRGAVMQAIAFEGWSDKRALPFFQARYDEYPKATAMSAETRGLLQCQAALAHDSIAGAVELLATCGAGVVTDSPRGVLKARALVAAGVSGAALDPLLKHEAAIVRVAAAAGAPKEALAALLADLDPIVAGTAATRAEALMASEVAPDLVKALLRLTGPQAPPDALEGQLAILSAIATLEIHDGEAATAALLDAEPYALREAAAHTITALTGETKTARLPDRLGPAPVLAPTTVRLTTTRGPIRIRLLVEDAPRTADSFLKLVKKPFYNGIVVHRVVPNFVSQAGDPRGDGSGGPGYTIPCEINPHRYGAGTVGMALAGRDTGGSQLFIAHSPQPSLDGLYTTFGEVIEGLDVAAALLEGDVITEARVE